MVITDRSAPETTFEVVFGSSGFAQAYVTVGRTLSSGGLVKVVYGPSGFLCVPTDAQTPEYFVGYVRHGYPEGSRFLCQIGGVTGGLRLFDGLDAGDWLSLSGDQIAVRKGEFPILTDFGAVHRVVEDSLVELMLLPRMVRETL